VNQPRVIAVECDDFHGEATQQDGTMTLRIAGTADYTSVDVLGQLLADVHAECMHTRATQTTVDLRQLEFMSSSCFKCFVSWITTVQDLPPASQYKVTFVSNPQVHWQRRSLHSLRCFAEDLIDVRQS
jgi:hypothetical protein